MIQSKKKQKKSFNYAQSGVSIDKGSHFVKQIHPLVKSTYRPEVVTPFGGFNSAFKIPKHYHDPLLISATDGVGTKLKFAIDFNNHTTIGIDLVAMCVNDLIVCGAEPLFFLDYFATSSLNPETDASIVQGICTGCKLAGCALIGGETAEMPGIYQAQDYDLAGFSVGVVEETQMLDGSLVRVGDKIIGLASSGIHSNGYSLVRSIIKHYQPDLKQRIGQYTLKEWLLTPTKIYVKDILALIKAVQVNAIVHITGGGMMENLPRILPKNVVADIDSTSWHVPEIFTWLEQQGNIAKQEMWRVFNQGIGMIVIVPPADESNALLQLKQLGAYSIGSIVQRGQQKEQVLIQTRQGLFTNDAKLSS